MNPWNKICFPLHLDVHNELCFSQFTVPWCGKKIMTVIETEVLSCLKSKLLPSELVTEAQKWQWQLGTYLSIQKPIFLWVYWLLSSNRLSYCHWHVFFNGWAYLREYLFSNCEIMWACKSPSLDLLVWTLMMRLWQSADSLVVLGVYTSAAKTRWTVECRWSWFLIIQWLILANEVSMKYLLDLLLLSIFIFLSF